MTIFVASQRPVSGTVGGVEVFIDRLRHSIAELRTIEPASPQTPLRQGDVRLQVVGRGPRSVAFTLALWWWLVRHRREVDLLLLNRVEHVVAVLAAGLHRRALVAVHGSSAYADEYFGAFGRRLHLLTETLAIRFCREVCILMGESPLGLPYYRARYPQAAGVIVARSVLVPPMPRLQGSGGEGPFVIGYLGRLDEPVKRIRSLVYLSRRLDAAGVAHRVEVVGEGPDGELLRQAVWDSGCADAFVFSTVSDVRKLAPGWHLGVVPSRFEGMCMAALELLAAEVPIVATDVGDMRAYASWGAVNVVAVSPNASSAACGQALGDAILEMRNDWPAWVKRASATAHWVQRRWWVEAIAEWKESLDA